MMLEKPRDLNGWAQMLDQLYGYTQNYGRTSYEIYGHVVEVVTIAAKRVTRHRDLAGGAEFLAKSFGWMIALYNKIKPHSDLETLILQKFPGVCPYCQNTVCDCYKTTARPAIDAEALQKTYNRNFPVLRRSIDDFQLMFRRIYGASWEHAFRDTEPASRVLPLFARLFEELGEVHEALRFSHLYPSNIENELADCFAWWFAIVSTLHSAKPGMNRLTASDLVWQTYPGYCPSCGSAICYCFPSPVRALMSKPALRTGVNVDRLTQLLDQDTLTRDFARLRLPRTQLPYSVIFLDIDHLNAVTDKYGHSAADPVLRVVASAIEQIRRPKDRAYRAGGDEFAVLCSGFTAGEAAGMAERIIRDVRAQRIDISPPEADQRVHVHVSLTAGVAESNSPENAKDVKRDAERAMHHLKDSERRGRVLRWSSQLAE